MSRGNRRKERREEKGTHEWSLPSQSKIASASTEQAPYATGHGEAENGKRDADKEEEKNRGQHGMAQPRVERAPSELIERK
jgi:hypothetical protein